MKKIIIISIILIILAIPFFIFSISAVSGNSMEPTLKDGDKILVYKWAYQFKKPQRGDLILLKAEDKIWVKRIVGLPGETIEIKDGKVNINEKTLIESYVKEIHTYGDQRVVLLDNQYYVLGDNREPNQSIDSRIMGPITGKNILGKVIATFSPKFKFLNKQLFQLN